MTKNILIDINSLITDFSKLCTKYEFINYRAGKTHTHTGAHLQQSDHSCRCIKWSFIEMNNLCAVCGGQDLPCNDIYNNVIVIYSLLKINTATAFTYATTNYSYTLYTPLKC